jgi:hypothetical protein
MEAAIINFPGCSAQVIAVANGATTPALLEHLVKRKILDSGDLQPSFSAALNAI